MRGLISFPSACQLMLLLPLVNYKVFRLNSFKNTLLAGANLKGVDMEGSQMTGINLRVATLKNAKLKNCNLRGATLAGTDLEVSLPSLKF